MAKAKDRPAREKKKPKKDKDEKKVPRYLSGK